MKKLVPSIDVSKCELQKIKDSGSEEVRQVFIVHKKSGREREIHAISGSVKTDHDKSGSSRQMKLWQVNP